MIQLPIPQNHKSTNLNTNTSTSTTQISKKLIKIQQPKIATKLGDAHLVAEIGPVLPEPDFEDGRGRGGILLHGIVLLLYKRVVVVAGYYFVAAAAVDVGF